MHPRAWMAGLVVAAAAASGAPGARAADAGEVGLDEHLGGTVPLDAVLRDEAGKPVRLGSLVDRPTILIPVYYRCPGVCSPLMSGVVDALEQVRLEPGRDYRVLSVSFVDTEGPDLAAAKRRNYLAAFRRPFPPEAWRFLTGARAPLAAITDAIGFRYRKVEGEYDHPAVLVFLSPQGRIVRYMSGVAFLPLDVQLALLEASQGRPGVSVRGALLYCYSFDPKRQSYAFNLLRVAGTATLLGLLLVVGTLTAVAARRRRREEAARRG